MTGLLLIFLSCLYILASLSPSETSAADSLQKPDSPGRRLDGKGRSDIKHSANFAAHAIPHSSYAGGGAHGVGEGGTNGESGSSSPKGGGVIPIYAGAAGANNNHHHGAQHGSGARIHTPAQVHALTAAVLALCCVFI